jgi:hypothetical protein
MRQRWARCLGLWGALDAEVIRHRWYGRDEAKITDRRGEASEKHSRVLRTAPCRGKMFRTFGRCWWLRTQKRASGPALLRKAARHAARPPIAARIPSPDPVPQARGPLLHRRRSTMLGHRSVGESGRDRIARVVRSLPGSGWPRRRGCAEQGHGRVREDAGADRRRQRQELTTGKRPPGQPLFTTPAELTFPSHLPRTTE